MANIQADEQTWREIEDVLHDLALAAQSMPAADAFYPELLDRAVRVLAAAGGAVWFNSKGTWERRYQLNAPASDSTLADGQQVRLLEAVLKAGKPQAVPPAAFASSQENGGDPNGGSVGVEQDGPFNPTGSLLLSAPLTIDDRPGGVLQIYQRPGASPAVQDGYLYFLQALSELAADFHRNLAVRELEERAALWSRFEQFLERVHGSLDLQETVYSIANEGRAFLACDRLGVVHREGSKVRLSALSGVESVDRRSNLVRRLEALVQTVLSVGAPFWYAESSPSTLALPPQIETALAAYLDESQVRALAVVPLKAPAESAARTASTDVLDETEIIGALVLEWFDARPLDEPLRRRVDWIGRHCAQALNNAQAHRSLPFFSLMRLLQKMGFTARRRRLPAISILLTAVLAGLLLALVPADFDVAGRGSLQPEVRRDVFAPRDGLVHRLHAAHSQHVPAGAVLVELRDSKLDYEFTRVLGEIQTVRAELATVQSSLLSAQPGNAAAVERYHELTARESLLKETVRNLETQRQLLEEQRNELLVRSPIAGTVLTWDVDALLESRPVQRGQVLLTVGDLGGPWIVEMQVPDRRIGHVLSAQNESGGALPVSFLLAADPRQTYRGTVENVALVTDLDDSQDADVLVTVKVDKNQFRSLRPGASVHPKIHCGRRSLGYVWFHDLIEFVQRRVMF